MSLFEKTKLLIVDDSAFMRKLISDFFSDHPRVEVIGTARNGKDAIKKIQNFKPDVVTMDVEMPEMNGLEALKEVMEIYPVPVIMLSSSTQHGAETTLTAMEYGAVDFVAKPSGAISLDLHKIKLELVHKVEQAAKVSIAKLKKQVGKKISENKDKKMETPIRPFYQLKQPMIQREQQAASKNDNQSNWDKNSRKIVLIGTSTGGPRALQEVITKLPKNMNAPILIVQHMPPGFTKSLAERLNHLSEITVKEAEQGEILTAGTAYITPGGYHLNLRKVGSEFEIYLDQTKPPHLGHRPSVDVMFEDVSKFSDFDKVAVIMTGMGQDGSKGLQALKKNGNVIAIAESAETCIVYGMPRAAIETNLVDEIADVDDIAETIIKYLS